MKKKMFTVGKVYDLGTLGVNEVENTVQTGLGKVLNTDGVKSKFRGVSGKALELTFLHKYKEGEVDWLNYNPKTIYNIDANIITGHSFNGFRILDYWEGVPYEYTFFMPKGKFIGCYRGSAVTLRTNQVKKVRITMQPEKIVIRLMF